MLAVVASLVLAPKLALIPWPRKVVLKGGSVAIGPGSRIGWREPRLKPLAKILSDEIETAAGIRLAPTSGRAQIELAIDTKLARDRYTVSAKDRIEIEGGGYQAVAMGTATLLQALRLENGRLTIPKLEIEDRPASDYRGLMVDVARQYHSIGEIEQCVELCRLYRLNYLQLHLTDDQSFMFPSKAFPKLSGSNANGATAYTREELEGLVKFADERGVTIIPELEMPGHAGTIIRAMPDLFKIKGTKPYEHPSSIDFANDDVLAAIDTLIGEVCAVFHSSPYFHMGGDEADISLAGQNADFQAAFKRYGLPPNSQQEIYRLFINEVDAMARKRGKRLIVWEGFGRNPASHFPIPKDVLVMEFENAYYAPTDLLADGYQVVNASWTPLYVVTRHVWPASKVYDWDLTRFGRFANLYSTAAWYQAPSTHGIAGAQVCSWEGPGYLEVQNLRRVVPAMAERVWSPSAARSYEDFTGRLSQTDDLLDRLVHPVAIANSPLDAEDPNGFDVPCFTKPLAVTLRRRDAGARLRYTLDGKAPTADSTPYAGPIELTQTTTVRAAPFGSDGNRLGYETAETYYYVPPKMPNLATGKKVTVSGGTQSPQNPELAVDDNLDLASSWWASPAPQWLQVDLGEVYEIGRVEVFPYWDGTRYYQYTVQASLDGTDWTMLADRSKNTAPATQKGDEIRFATMKARYVRVTMLKNSANEGVHLVELRVWPPGP